MNAVIKKSTGFYFICVCLFFAVACSSAKSPQEKVALAFMDAYYVFANQNQALELSQGVAKEQLLQELELLKDVSGDPNAYRSRDILFELKRSQIDQAVSFYFYELTIMIPDFEDRKETVTIMVDNKSNKVTSFTKI
ncbi:MAG: hypothetical protein H7A33_02675 [Deltaproteobacteria bacterium]|nr:hypothetical protein [Deltaproteobacteria bacterium]